MNVIAIKKILKREKLEEESVQVRTVHKKVQQTVEESKIGIWNVG